MDWMFSIDRVFPAGGTDPDTHPGCKPERDPGSELAACLPFAGLAALEKREWAEPSAFLVPDVNLLWVPLGLARMFKGIFKRFPWPQP